MKYHYIKNIIGLNFFGLIGLAHAESPNKQIFDLGILSIADSLAMFLSRAIIAYGTFKLITWGIRRKNIDTPWQSGRYIGAIFSSLAIICSFNKIGYTTNDYYSGIITNFLIFMILGFVVGYPYKKFHNK
jgi:hypothetical protein